MDLKASGPKCVVAWVSVSPTNTALAVVPAMNSNWGSCPPNALAYVLTIASFAAFVALYMTLGYFVSTVRKSRFVEQLRTLAFLAGTSLSRLKR